MGSSFEVHVRLIDDLVEIRPIAGTRRRGENEEQDQANAADLLADPKRSAPSTSCSSTSPATTLAASPSMAACRSRDFTIIERYSARHAHCFPVSGGSPEAAPRTMSMRATFPAGTVSAPEKVRCHAGHQRTEKSKRCTYAGAVDCFHLRTETSTPHRPRTVLLKDAASSLRAGRRRRRRRPDLRAEYQEA